MTNKYNVSGISIREATSSDVSELNNILTEIVIEGGTTAILEPLSDEQFCNYFIDGERHICCFVALDESGTLLGFQSLETHPELPDDWADVATFTRRSPRRPGIGTHLFNNTRAFAVENGLVAINAAIRSDNVGGLSFYTKLGFVTWEIEKSVLVLDDIPIDRISKKYLLGTNLSY